MESVNMLFTAFAIVKIGGIKTKITENVIGKNYTSSIKLTSTKSCEGTNKLFAPAGEIPSNTASKERNILA